MPYNPKIKDRAIICIAEVTRKNSEEYNVFMKNCGNRTMKYIIGVSTSNNNSI